MGNKEMAVTECIVLNDLYKEAGEDRKKEQIIKDAYAIDPDDPRLAGLILASPEETEVKRARRPFYRRLQ